MKQKIFPSIMARSRKELDEDLKRLKGAVTELHLDFVDGKFAGNETFQFEFKLDLSFNYNAHLMVKNPEKWIKKNFRKFFRKIDLFIPQIEEIGDARRYIRWMKSEKKKVAFALNPETKVAELKPFLKEVDYVLVLTVHPGFYGSKFLKAPLKKIKEIKKINPKTKVIVDGGMCPETIGFAAEAGADFFVSGSFTTKSENPKEKIKELMDGIKKQAGIKKTA